MPKDPKVKVSRWISIHVLIKLCVFFLSPWIAVVFFHCTHRSSHRIDDSRSVVPSPQGEARLWAAQAAPTAKHFRFFEHTWQWCCLRVVDMIVGLLCKFRLAGTLQTSSKIFKDLQTIPSDWHFTLAFGATSPARHRHQTIRSTLEEHAMPCYAIKTARCKTSTLSLYPTLNNMFLRFEYELCPNPYWIYWEQGSARITLVSGPHRMKL